MRSINKLKLEKMAGPLHKDDDPKQTRNPPGTTSQSPNLNSRRKSVGRSSVQPKNVTELEVICEKRG